jgi:hypothetical protein
MTQQAPELSIAEEKQLLAYMLLYLYVSDPWEASDTENSAQIFTRSFVPKVASKRKRESDKFGDNRKRKAKYLEKKITIKKQYKSCKTRVGSCSLLRLSQGI